MMTFAGRLQEADARDIFFSVANNEPPPPGLDFKIVRVPNGGQKLSPPSLDFGCGLYVLLRAPAKDWEAHVPSELSDSVLAENDLAGWGACPWSLSGPQINIPNPQIQQRYCYPRGEQQHSSKGAAMWTQIHEGQEDIDCRILHVYHSNKRAGTPSPKCRAIAKTSTPKGGSKRQSKRKRSQGALKSNKKLMVKTESPDLSLEEDVLKSPQSKVSFELDSNLNFNSENIFDAAGATPTYESFLPFAPVQSNSDKMAQKPSPVRSGVNNTVQKTAFDSAALVNGSRQQYAAPNSYYYGSHVPYSPRAFGGSHGYPLMPRLRSSSEQSPEDGKMDLADFSSALQGTEENISEDVRRSTGVEQAAKLQMLQNWAKLIAEKPLQLRVPEPKGKKENVKESPGTPSITP